MKLNDCSYYKSHLTSTDLISWHPVCHGCDRSKQASSCHNSRKCIHARISRGLLGHTAFCDWSPAAMAHDPVHHGRNQSQRAQWDKMSAMVRWHLQYKSLKTWGDRFRWWQVIKRWVFSFPWGRVWTKAVPLSPPKKNVREYHPPGNNQSSY